MHRQFEVQMLGENVNMFSIRQTAACRMQRNSLYVSLKQTSIKFLPLACVQLDDMTFLLWAQRLT